MKSLIVLSAWLPLLALAQGATPPEKKDAAQQPAKPPALNLRLDSRELRSTIQPSAQETYKKQDAGGLPGLGDSSSPASRILEQQPSPEKVVPISNDRL
ncbi:MAG TPA: hypothetical protein VFB08_00375 [Burkholderiales bacterium]|nr:hypothetical protein [Burkholderiales bacterium]